LSWCRKNLAGAFRSHIINSRLVDSVTAAAPVRLLGSTSFLYMRKNDVYILAVTKNNANAMSTFYFMNSVSTWDFPLKLQDYCKEGGGASPLSFTDGRWLG